MPETRSALALVVALSLASCAASSGAAAPAPRGRAEAPEPRPHVYDVAPGQGQGTPEPDSAGVLEVSGTGEVQVAPDRVRLTFAVETEAASAREASRENARRMDAVHRALRAQEAPGTRIETFGYTLEPRYGRPEAQGARRIEGYRASNFVRVSADDVDAAGALVDAGIGAGANRVASLSFEASDTEEARLEALRRAVARARAQAEAIAGAMGVGLGEPLEVRGGADAPGPQPRFRMEAMAQAPVTPIEAGEQTVSASVTIRYRLEPRGR